MRFSEAQIIGFLREAEAGVRLEFLILSLNPGLRPRCRELKPRRRARERRLSAFSSRVERWDD